MLYVIPDKVPPLFKWFTVLFLGMTFSSVFAQMSHGKEFHRLFKQADSLSNVGAFSAAGQLCDQALEMKGGLFPDSGFYETGFYYWLDAHHQERAIFYLEKAMQYGWPSKEAIIALETDDEFELVRRDQRFREILQIHTEKREKYGGVADTLLEIRMKDQVLRQILECAQEKFSEDSLQLSYYYDLIERQDSLNFIYVEEILDRHGWIGKNKIGEKPNKALWQVIQHSSLETQEKYLPLLLESVGKGESKMSDFAFLQDRVLMKKGKKQRYGTQISTDPLTGEPAVYPVENPVEIDTIRATIGFEPISEYASFFGVKITSPADLDNLRVQAYWQEKYKNK